MAILYLKAVHIIFVVSWFAGLFYIIRLFIYHTEAESKPENERKILQAQFKIMESRLWYIITTPAMILTLITGLWMLFFTPRNYLQEAWMHIKLTLLVGLFLYHFFCQSILVQLKKGVFKYNSTQLRVINEIATLFLVAIVFVVELQHSLNWIWGVLGLLTLGITLMIAIKLYKKYRKR